MKRIYSIFFVLFVLCSVFPMCANAASNDNPVPKAKQGVVCIVAGILYDSNGEIKYVDEDNGQGTGFGVGLEGEYAQTFVTNRHVVEVGDEIYDTVYVFIDGADIYDGSTLVECDVVYVGEDADYAIIQAKAPVKGVSTLPLLPAELMETGDRVYALGFPAIADTFTDGNQYTVEDITVTDGIVSRYIISTEKFTDAYGVPEKLIAHTASINHGNSGGPLINELGQVIGINTYGFSDSIAYNEETERYELTGGTDNRYYATYIDYAMAALDKLGIEYVDASKPVLKEDDTNDGVIIVAAAGVVILAAVLFVVLRKKKQTDSIVILATNGPLRGRMWELTENRTYQVGRDPSGDIVYPSDTQGVSRNHCAVLLFRKDGTRYLEIRDNGATYGTFLNGQKLSANSGATMPIEDKIVWLGIGSDRNNLFIGNKTVVEKTKEERLDLSLGG